MALYRRRWLVPIPGSSGIRCLIKPSCLEAEGCSACLSVSQALVADHPGVEGEEPEAH